MPARTLPEGELGKLKTIFWRNNIVGFAPFLDVRWRLASPPRAKINLRVASAHETGREILIGTWYSQASMFPTAANS